MKTNDKAAWRPRRFDVAGAHPDEAWRAVANISEAVEEIRKAVHRHAGNEAVNTMLWQWRQNKPLRFGNAPDAEVQWFLAKGVEIMDALKAKMPFGLSDGSARCATAAMSWRSRWKRCWRGGPMNSPGSASIENPG